MILSIKLLRGDLTFNNSTLHRRKPAWTDRILYLPSPDIDLKQLAYRSHPEMTFSDHQPISADFDISVRPI